MGCNYGKLRQLQMIYLNTVIHCDFPTSLSSFRSIRVPFTVVEFTVVDEAYRMAPPVT